MISVFGVVVMGFLSVLIFLGGFLPVAAREVWMRSSSPEVGSSFGACGTNSPRKALAGSADVRQKALILQAAQQIVLGFLG